MRTPPRKPTPRAGTLRCGARTWPTDPECPNTATWHIAWLLAPRGHFSLVCDHHHSGVTSSYDYVDSHPAELNCDMPGTGWLSGDPSRCVIAPTADPVARAANSREQP
ncbi:hypothetical protein SGFS_013360 [Streptomyces graminofaciens]|uniref:Uncharacterized protein n=1 Tax=Streptomyces graminofaciens TaxID=68212 RepID=A0ABN5V9R4_9ACTN|nr:hypothetical protein [Streptomyces graminofaciens]BBC30042.1 hypothetical protein SGFS_013360 [Streptomyces graminofaciens]